MKYPVILVWSLMMLFSCTDHNNHSGSETVNPQNLPPDSVPVKDSVIKETNDFPKPINDSAGKAGKHPITLHWISWDKPGEASLIPAGDGWYTITGSQLNENQEYLNIDGKIRRVSSKELEFIGTVETRTRSNNGGKPCIKEGKQVFFAKGSRIYYRLQNMVNCEGGMLVDYVDIYPGTSGL